MPFPIINPFLIVLLTSTLVECTKREWTQHQYRFEAVTIADDNYFPHGAKFTYRKYACDKVVVNDKKPILSCRTPVGILTGK